MVRFVPTIIILDGDGHIVEAFVGYTDERILRMVLDRLVPEDHEAI